jgi:hypothetical protein
LGAKISCIRCLDRSPVGGGSDAEIIETIEYSAASLDQSRLQIEIEPGQTVRSQGDPLKVEVHYSVPIMTPIMGQFLSNPYPLQVSVTMRME